MRILIFMATVSLLSCKQNPSNIKTELPKDDVASTVVDTAKTTAVGNEKPPTYIAPDETAVNEAMKAGYGNKWHVLNDREAGWQKDAFDYFIAPQRKENPNYPYIAKGDYNADGKEDMAAIVTDSLNVNYQIAILLGADNILLWKEDVIGGVAISTVSKSKIQGMSEERTKKILMKGDGINVEYFEKASFVLYWDKSSFKRIQTGD